MLRTALNFYKALASYVAPINLKYADKICLSEFAIFPNLSDVFTNAKILFDFLLHKNTPIGLNLVRLGLFYELYML